MLDNNSEKRPDFNDIKEHITTLLKKDDSLKTKAKHAMRKYIGYKEATKATCCCLSFYKLFFRQSCGKTDALNFLKQIHKLHSDDKIEGEVIACTNSEIDKGYSGNKSRPSNKEGSRSWYFEDVIMKIRYKVNEENYELNESRRVSLNNM